MFRGHRPHGAWAVSLSSQEPRGAHTGHRAQRPRHPCPDFPRTPSCSDGPPPTWETGWNPHWQVGPGTSWLFARFVGGRQAQGLVGPRVSRTVPAATSTPARPWAWCLRPLPWGDTAEAALC